MLRFCIDDHRCLNWSFVDQSSYADATYPQLSIVRLYRDLIVLLSRATILCLAASREQMKFIDEKDNSNITRSYSPFGLSIKIMTFLGIKPELTRALVHGLTFPHIGY